MRSSFPFLRPSFIRGMARIFDFGGAIRENATTNAPENSDERAFFEDWEALRNDLLFAIKQVVKK